jgi:mRNA interferase RelE/StbE
MKLTVVISKSVQKQIDDLPNDVRERVVEKIQNLADEPRPDGVVKLKGSDNEYRIRVGDYRVRYEIDLDVSDINTPAWINNYSSPSMFKFILPQI